MAMNRANINWTAKSLAKRLEKGEVTTENAVQRGYVWDIDRQSLLIHSMLTGYPIPPFFMSKNDNIYSLLDGKQRATTIKRFLNDEFALKNIPEVEHEVTDEETQEVTTEILDLNGMKFSELPEDIQDSIKDYTFNMVYFDGITDDEVAEMFTRLNNGKPLSAIEITRVKTKAMETIREIAKHEIFSTALTESAIKKYTDEDIIIKSWLLMNEQNCSFETKAVRAIMTDIDITDEQKAELETAYTRILDSYNWIKSNSFDPKLASKIAKRVVTRTHLLSIVPFAVQSVDDDISVERFAKWLMRFYAGTRSASISEDYNDNARQGSSKPENIKRRNAILSASYNDEFSADITETA